MEYVTVIFSFCGSAFLAYLITKKRKTFWYQVLYNAVFLLVSGILMLMTGIQETTLLTYVLLLVITLLGILMRIVTPVVLNFVGDILSRMQNQQYEKQSYDQLMQEGHRMFFCVLTFTTLKVFLYVALFMSALNLF